MRGVILASPRDVQIVDRPDPVIVEPTDAIIRLAASCVCGSDLWPYRGDDPADQIPMGHEYVGTVTAIGDAVTTVDVGDFVVGSFFASDNTWRAPSMSSVRLSRTRPWSRNASMVAGGIVLTVSAPISSST